MSSSRPVRVLAAVLFMLTPVLAAAGQSVTVSPFASYIPSAATNPLAGFALTFGGTTGLALRASAEMSIKNPRLDSAAAEAGGFRPWGGDADAMLFLGGIGGAQVMSRALSPYVFAGIGMTGSDSAGTNIQRHNWSYGVGAAIPLGGYADVFAESRWRMAKYVLPTSQGAPDSRSEMRFGLSFHVGGASSEPRGSRPRRYQREIAERDDDVEVVVAPAQQPVVVVTPSQSTEPQVIVLEQPPAQETERVVVVQQEPTPQPTVVTTQRSRRRQIGTITTRQPVVRAPARVSGTSRVLGRTTRVRTQQAPIGVIGGRARRSGSAVVGKATTTLPRASAKTQPRGRSAVVAAKIKRAQASRSNKNPK